MNRWIISAVALLSLVACDFMTHGNEDSIEDFEPISQSMDSSFNYLTGNDYIKVQTLDWDNQENTQERQTFHFGPSTFTYVYHEYKMNTESYQPSMQYHGDFMTSIEDESKNLEVNCYKVMEFRSESSGCHAKIDIEGSHLALAHEVTVFASTSDSVYESQHGFAGKYLSRYISGAEVELEITEDKMYFESEWHTDYFDWYKFSLSEDVLENDREFSMSKQALIQQFNSMDRVVMDNKHYAIYKIENYLILFDLTPQNWGIIEKYDGTL